MKHVTTTTKDGFELHGLYSKGGSEKIIINIHGMAGNMYINSFYDAMHAGFPKSGWSFLATENKGAEIIKDFRTNNSIQIRGDANEIFEECIDDIDGWVSVAEQLGYKEIWLSAHSLGPSKTSYYMHKTKDPRVKGLIFLCPADMIGLVLAPKTRQQHERLLKEANELVEQKKESQLLSEKLWGDYLLSAKTYVNFFGEKTNVAIFNFFDSSFGWKIINEITLPVLGVTGTKDSAIADVKDPKEAMKQLESELKNSPRKKTIVYEGAHHDLEGFSGQLVRDILDFIS